MRPNAKRDIDVAVYENTQEEKADGKALGPYTEQYLLELIGEFILCRRSGLGQAGGVRPN